jgi:hypothetical protein
MRQNETDDDEDDATTGSQITCCCQVLVKVKGQEAPHKNIKHAYHALINV